VPLVSRHGMFPSRPTIDTVGPMTRTVRDAAVLLGVIAGYDPNDRVTAYAVGRIPTSFTSGLRREALKGARLGVIRQPMHTRTDPTSADYKAVHAVIDRALNEVKALGADLVEPVTIPDVADRIMQAYECVRDRVGRQCLPGSTPQRPGSHAPRHSVVREGAALAGKRTDE
jgi:Asp-tRNA(Asn)/Glu-tRNA(Gln) amidotransferase A subunit family amidase